MKKRENRTIEFPAAEESFKEAGTFINKCLTSEAVSKEVISETMLVFEAIFHNFLAQGVGRNKTMRLSFLKKFGELVFNLEFEGRMLYLFTDEDSPENRILRAYEDRIGSYYRSGINTAQITVKRVYLTSIIYCAVGLLLALLIFKPILLWMPVRPRMILKGDVLVPGTILFGNAALMIGAPVTFFSLVKNLIQINVVSTRGSDIRKLQMKSVLNSLAAIFFAAVAGCFLLQKIILHEQMVKTDIVDSFHKALFNLITGSIPASIFEPFESISPIPLIVLALLLTYVACSAGRYFTKLEEIVNICYTVFSKMLGLILFTLPAATFITFLTALLVEDYSNLIMILKAVLIIDACMFVYSLIYLYRLKSSGIEVKPFLKKLFPLIMENLRINSAIDAVPYNIRYCTRNFGMNRKRLEKSLPVLAEINLEGNCLLLMMIGMFVLFGSGESAKWYVIAIIAFLVLFLSLGAPNQPGSILIGSLIIMKYLGYEDPVEIAIYMEVAFGIFQNILNVIGDVIQMAVYEQQGKTASPQK